MNEGWKVIGVFLACILIYKAVEFADLFMRYKVFYQEDKRVSVQDFFLEEEF